MNTIQLFEEFKILLLNRNNSILGIYSLSKGGITGTLVDIKPTYDKSTVGKTGGLPVAPPDASLHFDQDPSGTCFSSSVQHKRKG